MSEMSESTKMEPFWDDRITLGGHAGQILPTSGSGSQYERNLNFTTGSVDDNDYGYPKKKTVRDPLSHRIIEKRRRDRMNNCLADLARLLPPSSLRKGRGRIEKTEIVELAIKHLRHLQCHPCPSGDKCEFNYIAKGQAQSQGSSQGQGQSPRSAPGNSSRPLAFPSPEEEHFRLGFNECMSETMHFLVEEEGMYPGDPLCIRILQHLKKHSDNLMREHFGKDGKLRFLNDAAVVVKTEDSSTPNGTSSGSSGYQANGSSSGSDGNGGQEAESPESYPISLSGQCQGPTGTGHSERSTILDYEGENSCCSTQLSLDISDPCSEAKSGQSLKNKPPIPTIICSTASVSCSTTRRSSEQDCEQDSSSLTSSHPRYKFKNNIKQRFINADHDHDLNAGDNLPPSPKSSHSCSTINNMVTKASLKETVRTAPPSSISEGEDMEETQMGQGVKHDLLQSQSQPPSPPETALALALTSDPTPRERDLNLNLSTISSTTTTPPSVKITTSTSTSPESNREDPEKTGHTHKPPPLFVGDSAPGSRFIPAFALHEKGLFYIPLALDKSTLSPFFLSALEKSPCPSPSASPPPLHPVTINVCFLLSELQGGAKGRRESAPGAVPPSISIPIPCPPISAGLGFSPRPPPESYNPSPLQTVPLTIPKETRKGPSPTPSNASSQSQRSNSFSSSTSARQTRAPPPPQIPLAMTRYPPFPHQQGGGQGQGHAQPQSYKDLQFYPYHHHQPHSVPLGDHHQPILNGGGYSSSGSSTSSTGNQAGRGSRKRSVPVPSLSPGSGSGASTASLGYHSFQEKFVPLPVPEALQFPGGPFSYSHQHQRFYQGQGHGHGGHDPHPHILGVYAEKRECLDRRSPNKRAKRGREMDELVRPKPMQIGLPIIPLPPTE